jgi:hypothetical protein
MFNASGTTYLNNAYFTSLDGDIIINENGSTASSDQPPLTDPREHKRQRE